MRSMTEVGVDLGGNGSTDAPQKERPASRALVDGSTGEEKGQATRFQARSEPGSGADRIWSSTRTEFRRSMST